VTDQLNRTSRNVLAHVSAACAPSAVDQARGWARLQATIPMDLGPLQPGPLAGPAPAVAKWVVLSKWLAAGALALGAGGAGVWWSGTPTEAPTVSSAPALKPLIPMLTPMTSGTTIEPPHDPPASHPLEAPHLIKPPPSLAADADLLHAARVALQAGNNALARQKLSEHARLYPRSQLRAARALLRVKLLCAEGDPAAAMAEARKLRSFAPGSSETTGLSGTCAAQ
jgi:hypothetical protein